MSGTFAGERVLVVGLAKSGLAAARALAEEGAAVRVSEERAAVEEPEAMAELTGLGIEVALGGHLPEHLDGITLVVTSPGVPERAPILVWAGERGLPVWSELELGGRLCRVPFVAVTGTNGKSTTTEMIASIMRASGLEAIACGNIGYPFTTAARERFDALAVEASSFQLRFARTFRPRVSVLLNLAPDHLDWHGSIDAYAQAKSRICEFQGGGDVHVGNAEDLAAAAISRAAPCRVAWFRLGEPDEGEVGYVGEELVARIDHERRLGRPPLDGAAFREDSAAAAAAAIAFGLEPQAVTEGLRVMRPLSHRGEEVARAGSIAFIDNSKATNVHATIASLRGRDRVVLIAGGLSKGVDLSPLVSLAPQLSGVVVIGAAAAEIAGLFEGIVTVRKAGSMEEAVRSAYDLVQGGGSVVLAPACASWDMFRDYQDRGERFSRAAALLSNEVEALG